MTDRTAALAAYQIARHRAYHSRADVSEIALREAASRLAASATSPEAVTRERDFLVNGELHPITERLVKEELAARDAAHDALRAEAATIPNPVERVSWLGRQHAAQLEANPGWAEGAAARRQRLRGVALAELGRTMPWLVLHLDEAPGRSVPASAAGVGASSAVATDPHPGSKPGEAKVAGAADDVSFRVGARREGQIRIARIELGRVGIDASLLSNRALAALGNVLEIGHPMRKQALAMLEAERQRLERLPLNVRARTVDSTRRALGRPDAPPAAAVEGLLVAGVVARQVAP